VNAPSSRSQEGFTLLEALTALVVVGVIAAIAIPTWRTHLLRARRADGMAALIAVQRAQDVFFGRHARYAAQLTAPEPAGLGLAERSEHGFYRVELATGTDGLGYLATVRAGAGSAQSGDTRCAMLSIDHMGQRRAEDSDGADRTPDCWK
jgi:type IV pilus assembly protein PilE